MKRISGSSGSIFVLRVMVLLIIVLVGIIIAGTIYAFVRAPGSGPLFSAGGSGEAPQSAPEPADSSVTIFTGAGRMRIPLSGSSTLILSIAFPYSSGDLAFAEELAAKTNDFRSIAADYFASLPAEKLVNLDEDAAKTEILKRYNAGLRLGKITALYFNDLIIME